MRIAFHIHNRKNHKSKKKKKKRHHFLLIVIVDLFVKAGDTNRCFGKSKNYFIKKMLLCIIKLLFNVITYMRNCRKCNEIIPSLGIMPPLKKNYLMKVVVSEGLEPPMVVNASLKGSTFRR